MEKKERIEGQTMNRLSSKYELSLKQTQLDALIDPQRKIEDYSKKVAEGLIEIENDMRGRLRQQQAASSSATELYDLKSRPLKVDQEIEGGTWQFTREEFKTYVEAMGVRTKAVTGFMQKLLYPKKCMLCTRVTSSPFSMTLGAR